MDWLQLIASIIDSLAGPATIGVAIYLLRKPIGELLPNLWQLRYKDLEIEFSIKQKLADCVEEIAQNTKRGILHLLQGDLARVTETGSFEMLKLEGYAHRTMGVHSLMSSSRIPPDLDMLDRLAMPKIDLVLLNKPECNHDQDQRVTMSLLELAEKNLFAFDNYTIQQIVAICGDGNLTDGSECSIQLRRYLELQKSHKLSEYAAYCLDNSLAMLYLTNPFQHG